MILPQTMMILVTAYSTALILSTTCKVTGKRASVPLQLIPDPHDTLDRLPEANDAPLVASSGPTPQQTVAER